MAYRAILAFVLALISQIGLSQNIEIRINRYRQRDKKIKIRFEVLNKTDTTFTLNNFRREITGLIHISKQMADSINFDGLDFQIHDEVKSVEIFHLPFEIIHRSQLSERIHFLWIKLRNKFQRKKVKVKPGTSQGHKIIVNLEGFDINNERHFLNLIYHLKNADFAIESNKIILTQDKK
jgi:hypothetical protein